MTATGTTSQTNTRLEAVFTDVPSSLLDIITEAPGHLGVPREYWALRRRTVPR